MERQMPPRQRSRRRGKPCGLSTKLTIFSTEKSGHALVREDCAREPEPGTRACQALWTRASWGVVEPCQVWLGLSLARTAISRWVQPSRFRGSATVSKARAGVLLAAE